MELSHVKGLGPAKQESLKAAGIKSVEDLVALDLRKNPEIPGISPDALKNYKTRARQLLRDTGSSKPASKSSAKGTRPKSAAKSSAKTASKSTVSKAGNGATKTTSKPAVTRSTAEAPAKSQPKQTSGKEPRKSKGWLRRILRR